MGQITPSGCMTPSSHNHTPIHYSSMGNTPYSHTPLHSHPGSGYATPHGPQDLSGIVTPDLDLPLDFSGLDDLPAVGGDNLPGFPQPHTPTAHTPHTHHYTPQQHTMHSQHHLVQNHQQHQMHSMSTIEISYLALLPLSVLHTHTHTHTGGDMHYAQQQSYNPPSPAVMETSNGAWPFNDSEY